MLELRHHVKQRAWPYHERHITACALPWTNERYDATHAQNTPPTHMMCSVLATTPSEKHEVALAAGCLV